MIFNSMQNLELNSPHVFSMMWTPENRTHSHPLNKKFAEGSSFEQSYLIFFPSCNHVSYVCNLLSIFSHLFIFRSIMLYPSLPLPSHMHYLALIFIKFHPKRLHCERPPISKLSYSMQFLQAYCGGSGKLHFLGYLLFRKQNEIKITLFFQNTLSLQKEPSFLTPNSQIEFLRDQF